MEAAWWGRVAVDVKSEKLMTYTTSFRPDLETQAGLIIQLAQMKMYGLPAHYLQTYGDRVSAVRKTPDSGSPRGEASRPDRCRAEFDKRSAMSRRSG